MRPQCADAAFRFRQGTNKHASAADAKPRTIGTPEAPDIARNDNCHRAEKFCPREIVALSQLNCRTLRPSPSPAKERSCAERKGYKRHRLLAVARHAESFPPSRRRHRGAAGPAPFRICQYGRAPFAGDYPEGPGPRGDQTARRKPWCQDPGTTVGAGSGQPYREDVIRRNFGSMRWRATP